MWAAQSSLDEDRQRWGKQDWRLTPRGLDEIDIDCCKHSISKAFNSVVRFSLGEHPIATRPLNLLLSQHTVCEVLRQKYLINTLYFPSTLSTHQEWAPKPSAPRGWQSKATGTVEATDTPTRSLTRCWVGPSQTLWTLLPKILGEQGLFASGISHYSQHWTGPLLQEPLIPEGWWWGAPGIHYKYGSRIV